ncbi:hypothetical protein [Mucilaginibacter myungsuensis]|uniref:Uncharacterized protein n=1 Tax=Mucilaginibacter myungsuensis TaxID=649104 RepID=A0A929KXA4_9SPHI|nr:hypothetical protein [Mucilaginibacter myungsuensis]MBE9662357.1 hypothetical protein [Mucilaginibacter myungsuensis]MDN3599206.1 hypothetical protein [Mucilaginibacter myungsuensis]
MAEPKPAWNRRDNSNIGISDMDTIRFDYGMKTIKFGGGLDEAEANHLLQRLKDKKILTAHNLAAIV